MVKIKITWSDIWTRLWRGVVWKEVIILHLCRLLSTFLLNTSTCFVHHLDKLSGEEDVEKEDSCISSGDSQSVSKETYLPQYLLPNCHQKKTGKLSFSSILFLYVFRSSPFQQGSSTNTCWYQIANWFDLTIRIPHHYASTSQCMVVVCTGLGPIQGKFLFHPHIPCIEFLWDGTQNFLNDRSISEQGFISHRYTRSWAFIFPFYHSIQKVWIFMWTYSNFLIEQQLMEVYRKRVSFYFPCFLKYGLKSGTILTIHFRLFSGSGKTICDHYTLVLYQTLPRTSQVHPYSREFLLSKWTHYL